ncbi:MAG: cold shock domain-containing protein [Dongiaceae bacterium]
MSTKIPQSEWDAIVARRRQGEPVASIARSYGCSPPLIYRILSRQQEGAGEMMSESAGESPETEVLAEEAEASPEPAAAIAAPAIAAPSIATPPIATRAEPPPVAAAPTTLRPAAPAPIMVAPERQQVERQQVERQQLQSQQPERPQLDRFQHERSQHERVQPDRGPEPLPRPERPTALSASLDAALRTEIEETINAFRSAFDAALSEGSTEAHAALRSAASDLMRAGARTTIVLERLAAPTRTHPPFPGRNGGDRPSAPLPVPPRRPPPPPAAESAAQPAVPAPVLQPGESVRMTGAVKWYNAEKGFGFIAVESGHRDVFVRASALQRSGLSSLAEGQQVTLEVTQGRKGPEAIEVRLAE